MIGVDTNVLVRLLTADDEQQHRVARAFFDSRTPDSPAFVSAVALAETICVLRSSYRIPYDEIMGSLVLLLDSDDFVIEGREAVEAVRDGAGLPAQLVDFMVAHLGQRAGCRHTVTFDRKSAQTVGSMELLT